MDNELVIRNPISVSKQKSRSTLFCACNKGTTQCFALLLPVYVVESAPRLSLDSHDLAPFVTIRDTSHQSASVRLSPLHSDTIQPILCQLAQSAPRTSRLSSLRTSRAPALARRRHRSGLDPCSVRTDCPATDSPSYCLEHAIRSHRTRVSGFDITDTTRYGVTTTRRGRETKTSAR